MKYFIFDLYNTLINVRTDEFCEAAWAPVIQMINERGVEVSRGRLAEEFVAYWHDFNATPNKKYQYPECDCVSQFEYISKKVGCAFTREQATEALIAMRRGSIKHLILFDGVKQLLSRLRERGAKLYLLSNAQSAFTRLEIEQVGLSNEFDGMLLSSDCGCRKPDPAFFGMLFDKYGIDKSSAVMIGDDSFSDGEGAKNAGISFIHVPGGAAAHADEILKLAEGDE